MPQDQPGVRKIVEAMTARALARCAELGIEPKQFYLALLEEEAVSHQGSSIGGPDGVAAFFEAGIRRAQLRQTMSN